MKKIPAKVLNSNNIKIEIPCIGLGTFGSDSVKPEQVANAVKDNEKRGSLGIILPRMKKDEFFNYIVNKGTLPRKTFSMGEGIEKRYYLEARKIVN